jgi:hypothetical protein
MIICPWQVSLTIQTKNIFSFYKRSIASGAKPGIEQRNKIVE